MTGSVVVAGAGHAGFQLAMSLRQNGFAERIMLVNDEGHLPYQRPPLSKAYLKGWRHFWHRGLRQRKRRSPAPRRDHILQTSAGLSPAASRT